MTKLSVELASTSRVATPAPTRIDPVGAPAALVRRNKRRQVARDGERAADFGAEQEQGVAVPKALIAAMIATSAPAPGPRIGAMASAKGALLLAAIALGSRSKAATVAAR